MTFCFKFVFQRTVGELFSLLREATDVEEVSIKMSFLEIYNEVVRDLLNPNNMKLRIRERPDESVFVEGLMESFVTNERDIFSLIARGEANRSVGVTDMNKSSSRSHSLLTLSIEQKGKDGSIRVGKLNFGGLFWDSSIQFVSLFIKAGSKRGDCFVACFQTLLVRKRSRKPARPGKLLTKQRKSISLCRHLEIVCV